MDTMTKDETRSLPTGTWKRTGPDEWTKLCGKCGGTGYLPGYEFIDGARCWGCMRSGVAGTKNLTTDQLDRKEKADERRAAQREAKRAAEIALHAEEWKREQEAERAIEVNVAHERALVEAARRDGSRHLDAAEKDKIEVTGVVTVAHTFEAVSYSGFGTDLKRIIALDLGDGVTVKTFTQAGWSWEINRGDTVTIKATVKGHGEYEGVKETTVTRATLVNRTPKEPEDV